ncbi:hypothetical protein GUJ93_ZPchr0002g23324 [Zizania palustris]|uniref:Uncharacterized protein n=1 Tax=Zizania palustris TaxID=103762 RepID=A0A8J5V5I9_ZIZPA|nr:hypothetical protein GUJ93_ZPchr0002g23324 [Zizania palustris]
MAALYSRAAISGGEEPRRFFICLVYLVKRITFKLLVEVKDQFKKVFRVKKSGCSSSGALGDLKKAIYSREIVEAPIHPPLVAIPIPHCIIQTSLVGDSRGRREFVCPNLYKHIM